MSLLLKNSKNIGARICEHLELGRRPSQPAYPGKVDRVSGCGFLEATNRANSVDPPPLGGFFVFSLSHTSGFDPSLLGVELLCS